MDFPSKLQKWEVFFDKIERVTENIYRASFKEATVLVDDSSENEVIYYWRAEDGGRTIVRSYLRSDNNKSLEDLEIDDDRISKTPAIYGYLRFPVLYIDDKDKTLFFRSYRETVQCDEKTWEQTVSYMEDGIVATPTEGWLAILEWNETPGITPRFQNKEAEHKFECYAGEKITGGVSADKLWIQDIIHAIRDKTTGDYLTQLNFRHFPTASDSIALRKSAVLCNKVKVVLKFSWALFWKKASEFVYLLVLKPKESNGGIGKILLGDFTQEKGSQAFYGNLAGILVDFLNWKLFTSPMWTKVVRNNELKEPFILDPSKYVR